VLNIKKIFPLKTSVLFFFSICFETDLFVSVLSVVLKWIHNTETNLKIYFLVSRNKPKINRNRCKFQFVSVRTENFFVCFVDTLVFVLLFLFCFSVCLETDLFFSVFSVVSKLKLIGTESNQNKNFLVSRNKPNFLVQTGFLFSKTP
jgi:hypothetical protein